MTSRTERGMARTPGPARPPPRPEAAPRGRTGCRRCAPPAPRARPREGIGAEPAGASERLLALERPELDVLARRVAGELGDEIPDAPAGRDIGVAQGGDDQRRQPWQLVGDMAQKL